MMQIPITSDLNEIRKIGEKIFNENRDRYDERWMSGIRETLNAHMPNASKEEMEEVFFRSVYDYWMYGNNTSEEFYFDFANKTHEQKSEYMTHRMRYVYMDYLNPKESRHYLGNKWEAYQLMKDYYRRDAIQIKDENDYEAFCEFVKEHSEFVVKPIGLGKGKGVHKVNALGTDPKQLFDQLLEEIADNVRNSTLWGATALILEEIIKQDPEIAVLHPDSVNSIRLVTVKIGDKVHIWYPRIDIGRGGSFLINAAMGGIMALVDSETGVIIGKGIPEEGELFEYHPDTNIRIEGFQIPKWKELIAMATDLMLNVVPDLCYVGWDMALSEKGWCVVEGNWAGEFVGDQLGVGHGLRKEFEELIGWKPDQTYWWEKE